jgi:hypothetical protein
VTTPWGGIDHQSSANGQTGRWLTDDEVIASRQCRGPGQPKLHPALLAGFHHLVTEQPDMSGDLCGTAIELNLGVVLERSRSARKQAKAGIHKAAAQQFTGQGQYVTPL